MFNRPYYDPEDVTVSRRIKSTYTNDEGEAAIQYEDDENDEAILCLVDGYAAEAFVEAWNDAIKEEERVAGVLKYHQGINSRASKELDQKDDRIKELNKEMAGVLKTLKITAKGLIEKNELLKGLREEVTALTQSYESAAAQMLDAEEENRKLKAHRDQLYDHLRAILDAQMPSEDNDETAAARQLLCNEDDIEKRIQEEGYERDE